MQLKKLLEKRSLTKVTSEKAAITLEIAVIYSEQGDHESALSEYKNYLDIWLSKGNRSLSAIAHRYIAECCIELCDFTQAILHTNNYLQMATDLGDKVEQQRAYVTLGRCFLNRVESMKDGHLIYKSLCSAYQALLNSIKLIKELPNSLDAKHVAEMRAVSLLNLGHVLRAQHVQDAAMDRFFQALTLAQKYTLPAILFRACYQIGECLINRSTEYDFKPSSRSSVLEVMQDASSTKALDVIQKNIRSPFVGLCNDNESKLLCNNLKELLGQVFLVRGECRKAAKIFKHQKIIQPTCSSKYQSMISKSMRLMNLFNQLPKHVPENFEMYNRTAKVHEKIGDIYSGLELYGAALKHYYFMLIYAELAYREFTTEEDKHHIVKLVDSAIISMAETYRVLAAYNECVTSYRREILWATSSGLPVTDLVTSWLSLAQAQRACFTTTTTNTTDRMAIDQFRLEGSETALNSIKYACQLAKSTGTTSLIVDCLKELLDYYKERGADDQVLELSEELARLEETNVCLSELSTAVPVVEDEDEYDVNTQNTQNNSDDEAILVEQFVDNLSSDSELEECLGNAAIMEEFNSGKRASKSGKALCLKTNAKGETPLHVATINGDLNHVIKLVEVLEHPVNVPDGAGWLPIHEAAFHDRTEIAIYLLDHDAAIDDPGYLADLSTPLFEAIHNGALSTALVLVQRGANLWHKNREGEYLPNLLDDWQPTRRATGTYGEQRSRFDELLTAIKSRLGADYDRWCNLKRDHPLQSSQSSGSSNSSSPQVNESKHALSTRKSSKKYCHAPSLTECESSSRVCHKFLRNQNWDQLLVDLDEDPPVCRDVDSRKSKSKKKDADAEHTIVKTYQAAMQAVGSFIARTHESQSNRDMVVTKRKRKSTAIDADDASWLINDEIKRPRNRSVSSLVKREHFDTADMKKHRASEPSKSTETKGAIMDRSFEFIPNSDFTSTQIVSSTSSKTIPSTLITSHSPIATASTVTAAISSTQSHKLTKSQPFVGSTCTERKPLSDVNNDVHSAPATCSIKVSFPDISVLVPIDSLSRSVSWLATEAMRRRQILMGLQSLVTQTDTTNLVRLSTRDGALLLHSDRLYSVLPALGQSTNVIELLAEFIEPIGCEGNSPHQLTQLTHQSQLKNKLITTPSATTTCTGVLSQWKCSTLPVTTPTTPSASVYLQALLDKWRHSGIIDLSYLCLGDAESYRHLNRLTHYGLLHSSAVTELLLQGNALSLTTIDDNVNQENTGFGLFLNFINSIASQLISMNLSTNLLTIHSIYKLCENLSSLKQNSQIVMPRLQTLNLSYNPFIGNDPSFGYESPTVNASLQWIDLLRQLMCHFPKLTKLSLAGCCLGEGSTGADTSDALPLSDVKHQSSALDVIHPLSELDLSWNPCISPVELTTLFVHLKSLRYLCLHGCSHPTSFNIIDKQYDHTLLPLCPSEIVDPPLNKSDKYQSFWEIRSDHPTRGDQLMETICLSIIENRLHLQTLDMGYCQLTKRCVPILRRLFDAPGNSLTKLILDHNPDLRSLTADSPIWIQLIQATAQTASVLVSLKIDLPQFVNTASSAVMNAFSAVESKLLPAISPNPLQELILTNTPKDWSWQESGQSKSMVDQSDASVFLSRLANLFSSRFGQLFKLKHQSNSISFGIL